MKRSLSRLLLSLFTVILLIIPLFTDNNFYLNIFILIFIFAAVSGAWNILGGYGGQLSLGHAMFFGLGAYTTALLHQHFGLTPWLGIVVAVLVAVLASLLIGWPTFRLRGPFFTLATIAFAEVLRHVANFWRSLTNGASGLNIRFDPSLANMIFREYEWYYYLALLLFALVIVLTYWIDQTKIGYYLKAIREDEDSAATLGIDVAKYKMLAMLLSSGLTAMAGVIYAQYMLYIDPNTVFHLNFSIEVALIAIVGGMGTVFGPAVGAFLVIPLNELLRASFPNLDGMNFFIYGAALILIVSFLPNGLLPIFKLWINNFVTGVRGGRNIDS